MTQNPEAFSPETHRYVARLLEDYGDVVIQCPFRDEQGTIVGLAETNPEILYKIDKQIDGLVSDNPGGMEVTEEQAVGLALSFYAMRDEEGGLLRAPTTRASELETDSLPGIKKK